MTDAVESLQRKRAFICGISGQDGAYLAELLLSKGYEVVGASRDPRGASLVNLRALGIADKVTLESMSLADLENVVQTLARVQASEIYNLAGQSSVGLSFEFPHETMEGIARGTLNLLEAIRLLKAPVRLFSAGSGECFGNTDTPADEATPFRPRSPYAVAKAAAFWQVANYREAYGIRACTGILFPHESPLRPERFVTQKVIAGACRISAGSGERLKLGNLSGRRDWGWAPEYADAMWRMVQRDDPADFVIATGATVSLERFVELAFEAAGLNWKEHVDVDSALFRPLDISVSRANPGKALRLLQWEARYHVEEIVEAMVRAYRDRQFVPGA